MRVPWADRDWRRVVVYGLGLSGRAAAPVGQWAIVASGHGQATAPVVGDIAAVIELNRKAQVVVAGGAVFADVRRHTIDTPAPANLRCGFER